MSDEAVVKCPKCRHFVCAVPVGTPVRARCRGCALTFFVKARGLLITA